MSLMARVQAASGEVSSAVVQSRTIWLQNLKEELYKHISSDEIAVLMSENPRLAKNEIKSICNHLFEQDSWRDCPLEVREGLVDEIIDTVFGLGPLEGMLGDESITEIMVNGAQSVFFEREGKLYPSEHVFADDEQVRALIDRIIGPLGRRLDDVSPMVNARLKQGHRVNAIIPPLSLDGPVLTIRKFREHIFSLEEMLESGSVDYSVAKILQWAVEGRKNIAVSGGTGSGKTTLLNALSCKISPSERIITIEDSAELKFSHHPHVVRLEARPANAEGKGSIQIQDLVINALRMRPDRIIVGECRGGEALDMLQAMNTGHDGSLTTLHANSAEDAVTRLTTMVRYAVELPVVVIEAHIASALDLIVQTARAIDGERYVSEISSIGYKGEKNSCVVTPLYKRECGEKVGQWYSKPAWIEDLPFRGIASREEVNQWKQTAFLVPA